MKRLLIVGAGGHGRSVAEAVLTRGIYQLAGFVDDAAPSLPQVWQWPVFGPVANLASYREHADVAIVAIGNNQMRETVQVQLIAAGFELATVVHLQAIVSPRATMGPGSVVMAGAIVGTQAQLGTGVIVNCGAVVDHDCRVEDFGHLGINTSMAGESVLGRSAWMQAGASIGHGVQVAARLVLQPGTLLRKDQ